MSNLKRHKEDQKPSQENMTCSVCRKSYSGKSTLTKHLKQVHKIRKTSTKLEKGVGFIQFDKEITHDNQNDSPIEALKHICDLCGYQNKYKYRVVYHRGRCQRGILKSKNIKNTDNFRSFSRLLQSNK